MFSVFSNLGKAKPLSAKKVEKMAPQLAKLWSKELGEFTEYPANNYQGKKFGRLYQSASVLESYLDDSMNVVDIGCNTGMLSMLASQYCRSVVGIDANEIVVQKAHLAKKFFLTQKIQLGEVSFQQASIGTFLGSDEAKKINVVLAFQVLYYFSDAELEAFQKFLEQCQLVICTAKPEKNFEPGNQARLYEPDALESFLKKLGFSSIERSYSDTRWPMFIAFRGSK